MTQEWFESADFEKTANNDKKDSPSDPVIPEEELKEKEELPVAEENLQVNPEEQETDLEKVEKKDTQDTLLVKAGQDINIPDEPDRSPNSRDHE